MTRQPNVVLVVLDTARATDAPPVREGTMPTLAELAAQGTAYERAYANAPWSLPSHASLFTGAYPSRHGAHGGSTFLDEGVRTLAESFADSGYETIGVSNNTWITEEFGFARGFETFWKGWQYWQSDADMGTVARADEPREKLRRTAENLFDGNPLVNAVNVAYSELLQPAGDDGAARTTDRLESWMERDRGADDPFFAFVNYLEPHIDYRPPREYAERFLPPGAAFEEAVGLRQDPRAYDVGEYDLTDREFRLLRGLYRGELAYVDDQLERLRAALREAGEWEDTLLVVCGDHGENVGEHGFLGHQYNVYDTLLHVPLVVHGGAFTGGAGNGDALVQLSDVVPTLLDAAGVDDPELREQCQGPSFHPDADGERESVFAEYVAPQPSIGRLEERFGDVPEEVREYDRSLRTVRTREYKLVRGSDGLEELYDVREDPRERTDLSATRPGKLEELRDRLAEWRETVTGEAAGWRDRPAGNADADDDGQAVEMTDATEERLEDLGYL